MWYWPFNIVLTDLCYREHYLGDLAEKEKHFNVGLHLTVYEPVSCKLDMIVDFTELYSLVPVLITMTFIQGHSCMKTWKVLHSFFDEILS